LCLIEFLNVLNDTEEIYMLKYLFLFIILTTPCLLSGESKSSFALDDNVTTAKSLTPEEFVRLRCSLDGSEVFTEWSGDVYSVVPGKKQVHTFKIVGMNVARCIQDEEGTWHMVSRELNYYLDPKTGELIHRWENPNGETVPVVHVANNPVQTPLTTRTVTGVVVKEHGNVTFRHDLNLYYPNPLAGDSRFSEYSPQKFYQAAEFFLFTVDETQLYDKSRNAVDGFAISWNRVGPWLPWMKMGNTPGYMTYSTRGSKVKTIRGIHPILQKDIEEKMTLYKKAPTCKTPGWGETSWVYFKKVFARYNKALNDHSIIFPVAMTPENDQCR
jgi:hypothetical protein